MKFTPYKYQTLMMDHVWKHRKCALWAFMGAGKTVTTLTALEELKYVEDVYPVLVIAPLRVATSTWVDEIAHWGHLKHLTAVALCGTANQRKDAMQLNTDIKTINFEGLPWLKRHLITSKKNFPFKTVVIDEATKLKGFRLNRKSRAQDLAQMLPVDVRIIELSGTPAPNGLLDLWAQLWFLDRGVRLGANYGDYKDRWFLVDSYTWKVTTKGRAEAEISSRVSDICLTVRAQDFFNLDEAVVVDRTFKLPDPAQALYDTMQNNLFLSLSSGVVTAVNAATMSLKCLQIAAGAMYLDNADGSKKKEWELVHDSKLDILEEIIEESCGENILVSYQYRSDLERLKKRFPTGVALAEHDDAEKRWNEGKIPILFTHPASAGHGLNLQHGGSVIVHLNCGWNFEHYEQINERLGPARQMQSGYKRNCFIYRIFAEDTIDLLVRERITTKRDIQELLLDATARGGV